MGTKLGPASGSIATEFRVAPLRDLCLADGGIQTGPFGSQLHQKDYTAHGTPIITVEHIGDNRIIHQDLPLVSEEDRVRLSRYTMRKGDIIFSRVGSVDRRALVRESENGWLFSGRCLRVRVDEQKISPEYLSWFFGLESFKEYIRRVAVGATMPSLNTKILQEIPVYLPSLAEQKRISGILGALDDKIELNRKMNETLEQMAQALFKSWFVDFDPVHAKASGRQPAGIDKASADLFPDCFVDSELGKIPKGWKTGALDELVEPRAEKVAATADKDMTRYIALEDMPSKSLDLSKYQLGSAVNSSIIRFRKGDILFGSMRVYFHKVGLACFDGITRTTTFVLKPRKERLRHFSLLHLFSDEVIAFATTASIGTTIPYVRWDSLGKHRLAIPPDELLSRFDELAGNLTSKIAAQGEESKMLTDLRDSLLPRLLSGDLSLENNDTSA